LAGYANSVANVASFLATKAIQSIFEFNHNKCPGGDDSHVGDGNTLHPYVGIVDHISVMPLLNPPPDILMSMNQTSSSNSEKNNLLSSSPSKFIPSTPHGQVAFTIGQIMSNETLPHHSHGGETLNSNSSDCNNLQVFYYGSADPDNTSLAEVRKRKTNFFKSGGLEKKAYTSSTIVKDSEKNYPYGTATIGAPKTFVENFNIRLHPRIPRSTAVQLARHVREIDGPNGKKSHSGLLGVEALTLPYSNERWEVACNLKHPEKEEGSSAAIAKAAEDWEKEQEQTLAHSNFVECSYRVGSTEEMCWNILSLNGNDEALMKNHDEGVVQRLKDFILG